MFESYTIRIKGSLISIVTYVSQLSQEEQAIDIDVEEQRAYLLFLALFVPGYFIPTFDWGCADLLTPHKILTRATVVLKLLQHLYWSIPSLKKIYS